MGITHVVRGSEYLSSAPKYNLLYEAFGWEIPTYVHCASVMIDAKEVDPETGDEKEIVRKMSKRHGDPSYEDLVKMGYLSSAIVNYVTLLGWSPKGELAEQEFFTMPELIEAFDIAGISKSPSAFNLEKLNYFNASYIRAHVPGGLCQAGRALHPLRRSRRAGRRSHRRPGAGAHQHPDRDPRYGGLLRRTP